MEIIKKTAGFTLIVIILLITFLVFYSKKMTTELNIEISKVEKNLGKKIVLDEDTLMIVDYSLWNSTYTLENKREISFKLVEKKTMIDE